MSQNWPSRNAGAIARLVPTMLPTITCLPELARALGHQQAFGEAAALVELDVDDVEPVRAFFEFDQRQDAFVGGDRHGAVDAIEFALRGRAGTVVRAATRFASTSAGSRRCSVSGT